MMFLSEDVPDCDKRLCFCKTVESIWVLFPFQMAGSGEEKRKKSKKQKKEKKSKKSKNRSKTKKAAEVCQNTDLALVLEL